jgi:uncharacterized protein
VDLDAEVFLDSAYLIALAHPGDEHHHKAREIAGALSSARTRILTTSGVLLEVGSALSKIRFRRAAIQLVDSLESSPLVEIAALSEALCKEGWELFRERLDKEWSWIDCISFALMRHRQLQQALTTDEHFEQAGFEALLRR